MTPDEIRKMFLFASEVRRIPQCDARREAADAVLADLTSRYMAENVRQAEQSEPEGPDWQGALEYVAELFQRLDACESDEGAVAVRRKAWQTISDAVQYFYQSPDLKPVRAKLFEMQKQANQIENGRIIKT